ncbi:hydroxysteroid 11-beta-dehydrogenase 1-like protein B [Rhineura floridana]|uniref:hydroxysteroid 11-beta-dehydrogenase 1-like protein B n=1 Tax=Rhineura floridana TaxID=261503 RepID=UPI002AC883F1|nr:hydroxysteroid 11-beta-dehydrogenase 1-like protein B [Rhineura floridana]
MTALKLFASLLVGLCAYYFYSQETFSEEMVRGKRVLVTGSSTGIGEQMAYEFARMGAHVMVTARTEKRLQEVVQKCLDLGASSAWYVVADMSNLTSAQQVVEETKTVLGGLDLLVLNHVKVYTGLHPFQGDMESVISTMTVNFFSYVQLTVSALSALNESRGSIIVISSMSGRIPSPFSVVYSSTKFALEGFYSGLRTEMYLQKIDLPITVAVLGYIDTDAALRALGGKIAIKASPKEDCAREIVKGGVLRQREVFYPYWVTKPVLLLRDWMPEVLEHMMDISYKVENTL